MRHTLNQLWRRQGLPGYWAILYIRAAAKHSAEPDIPTARFLYCRCCLQGNRHPRRLGANYISELTSAAHMFACLRIDVSLTSDTARLVSGLPGSALARWDSTHRMTIQHFMRLPQPHSLLTSIAWSHR